MSSNTAEVMDNETGEVLQRPVTTLAKVAPGSSRLLALDSMDEADFEARLAVLRTGQARMRRIQKELLVPDEDYGEIPGTGRGKPGEQGYVPGKPTLLKAGAEKLLKFYGLVPTFDITRTYGDGVTAPPLHVSVRCLVHMGDGDGPVLGQGDGTCSTWERKYRYRRGQRVCPSCEKPTIIVTKRGKPNEQWWCVPDKGGCGENFAKDDPAVVDQVVGDVDNPDPLDLDNTVVKMAVKRALVAASLLVTATSGLFTQDLDDVHDAHAQTARDAAQREAEETEKAIRPLLDRLAKHATLAALDADVRAVASQAEAMPEAHRAVLRKRIANMRNAVYQAERMAKREPPPEPAPEPIKESPENAATRAELAAALTDEPPADVPLPVLTTREDEVAALALVEACSAAKSSAMLQKLWKKIREGADYAAAPEGVRYLAQKTVEALDDAIKGGA